MLASTESETTPVTSLNLLRRRDIYLLNGYVMYVGGFAYEDDLLREGYGWGEVFAKPIVFAREAPNVHYIAFQRVHIMATQEVQRGS